jgi:hypothetical protein
LGERLQDFDLIDTRRSDHSFLIEDLRGGENKGFCNMTDATGADTLFRFMHMENRMPYTSAPEHSERPKRVPLKWDHVKASWQGWLGRSDQALSKD